MMSNLATAKSLLSESFRSNQALEKAVFALQSIAASQIILAEEAVRRNALEDERWYGEPEQRVDAFGNSLE